MPLHAGHKTTAIIKTFERPDCLKQALTSLRARYRDMPIIVADDSRRPVHFDIDNVTWYQLPFDTGLSAGRNFLVNHVETEYTLLLDDDFVVVRGTDVPRLEHILDTTDLDLIGGRVMNVPYGPMRFEGKLVITKRKVAVKQSVFHETNDEYSVCDIVANFFLARTAKLKEVRWDPDLKLCEHVEFFMRAHKQMRIGFCPHVTIHHDRRPSPQHYVKYRQRIKDYKDVFRKKYGGIVVTTHKGKDAGRPARNRVPQPKILLSGTRRTTKRPHHPTRNKRR
jgi:GT2 family glycosyltransferase